jgi:hypothetical protein
MSDQPTDPTTLIHEPATDCQTYPAIDELKPGPHSHRSARGDPGRHPPVEAAPQPTEQLGVHGGPVGGPDGVDLVDRYAQGVGDLAGPGLGVGVDGVGVVEVAQHVGQALLDPGEFGVVAEVAAEAVVDQHPTEVVEDPERGDRGLGAVPGRAVPDQVRSAAGVGAHRAQGVHVRVVAVRLVTGGLGQRGRGLVGACGALADTR